MAGKEIILALSMGYRVNDPGPINRMLAMVVDIEQQKSDLDSICQVEIARCVNRIPALVISRHRQGKYLDTDECILQFLEYMEKNDISTVRLVAFPFIHRFATKWLIRKYSGGKIKVKKVSTGWVPFDGKSEQWFVRGPFRMIIYTILRLIGRKGQD